MMICTIVSNSEELQLTCKNEEEKPILTIKQAILGALESLYVEGYTEFWLNCEYGIPLWTAEMLCSMKKHYAIKLHIAVPYEEQTTNWTDEQRDRYFRMHQLADDVVIINTKWHSDCYHDAEQYMLNKSDLLFVFGTSADKLESVKAAQTMGVNVRFI